MVEKNFIKAIIVDDERGCVENLEYHLTKYCPDINIVARGGTIDEALQIIKTEDFDVAFLDVEIFDNNIFYALNEIQKRQFEIVFVTAYEQYALKALKLHAADYILKPLSQTDIIACYERIKEALYDKQRPVIDVDKISPSKTSERKLVLRHGEKIFVIKIDDLCYFKAQGAYTIAFFYFSQSIHSVTISKSINAVEKEMNDHRLYRIHKSYIINTGKINSIIRNDGVFVKINEEVIPVAKRRVHDFLAFLNTGNN